MDSPAAAHVGPLKVPYFALDPDGRNLLLLVTITTYYSETVLIFYAH